eukprot:5187605-Alexandrium_andersonii.AAC.1
MEEHWGEFRAEAERRRRAGRDMALRPVGASRPYSRAAWAQWLEDHEDSAVSRRRFDLRPPLRRGALGGCFRVGREGRAA